MNKKTGVSPALEKAISDMLKEVMDKHGEVSLTDKLKVIDRALKLEAVKAKFDDAAFGLAFEDKEDE